MLHWMFFFLSRPCDLKILDFRLKKKKDSKKISREGERKKGTGGKSIETTKEEKVGTRTVIRYRPQRLTKLFVETALRPKH